MANEIEQIVKEIADDLFPTFEATETQAAAVLLFLKDKQIATEQELAPYLEQAANASNIRWRATRVRLEHLIISAIKAAAKISAVEKAPEPQPANRKTEKEHDRNAPESDVKPTPKNSTKTSPADQERAEAARTKESGTKDQQNSENEKNAASVHVDNDSTTEAA